MDMYMRFDKLPGPIKGGEFDGCFQITTFSWGVGIGVTSAKKKGISASLSVSLIVPGPRDINYTANSECTIHAPFEMYHILVTALALSTYVLCCYYL
jgi:hypothetical protein